MIRRERGGEFLLITQHDHALISGELGECFGNEEFAKPNPCEQTLAGIRLHDCGWPAHDDAPTLNAKRIPLDVFETPAAIALKVWSLGVEKAKAQDPYAGLLVSLHVLALSVLALDSVKEEDTRSKFALAKFQQQQLQQQENLRAVLHLRVDKPGYKAASNPGSQLAEDRLQFNFRMLQVMDQMSLGACCTQAPIAQTREMPPRVGETPMRFELKREANDLVVKPWPFSVGQIELEIPACRVPGRAYKDEAEFHAVYNQCAAEVLRCRMKPG